MADRSNKGVTLLVDRKFFDIMEKARIKKQELIGGRGFNLTQRNFTAMLAKENFKFKINNLIPINLKLRRKRK